MWKHALKFYCALSHECGYELAAVLPLAALLNSISFLASGANACFAHKQGGLRKKLLATFQAAAVTARPTASSLQHKLMRLFVSRAFHNMVRLVLAGTDGAPPKKTVACVQAYIWNADATSVATI